jgi:3alpha(or 20beta)-hydroxysteroid dehydrogenase
MMKRFDHRTVIVTGGARGMGASHARGFVAEGVNVVIADVLEQEGRTLADELGNHAIFSRLDVTSDRDWAATVAAAEDAFGPVSVLVNNAAIVRFGAIAESEPAAWRQVIDINLTGTYLGIRAVVSSMRKAGGGAIVNMSAAAGMTAQFGLASYVASKWGMRGLTTRLVLFVASDEAGFSTGSEFIADGGHLLGPVPQQEHAEAAVA